MSRRSPWVAVMAMPAGMRLVGSSNAQAGTRFGIRSGSLDRATPGPRATPTPRLADRATQQHRPPWLAFPREGSRRRWVDGCHTLGGFSQAACRPNVDPNRTRPPGGETDDSDPDP